VRRDVPRGAIAAWSGSVDTIPLTWRLCDGSRGTPDLRDKFIVGAGNSYNPNDIGGAIAHNHNLVFDSHAHFLSPTGTLNSGTGGFFITSQEVPTGQSDNANINSPYYALCYIMYDGRLR